MLKAKIHRATITDANLHYEGSIAIDPGLMDASGIIPFEQVQIYNVTNGERFTTYAIEGERGQICLNGAAAWKGKQGDTIIIATYAYVPATESQQYRPTLVYVNPGNEITAVKKGSGPIS